jgi:STE24 endopeptidase
MKNPPVWLELVFSLPTILVGTLTSFVLHYFLLSDYLPFSQFFLIYFLFSLLTLTRIGEKVLVALTPGTSVLKGEMPKLLNEIALTITERAKIPSRNWLFAVEKSSRLNAGTSGRHLVVLTPSALRLPPKELRAVLAHEIGHQRNKDTIASHFQWWFTLPVYIILRTKSPVPILLLSFGIYLFSKNLATPAETLIFLGGFFITLIFFSLINLYIERLNELAADHFVYQVGFEEDLIATLSRFNDNSKLPSFLQSHPRTKKRISLLNNYLD